MVNSIRDFRSYLTTQFLRPMSHFLDLHFGYHHQHSAFENWLHPSNIIAKKELYERNIKTKRVQLAIK
jgi:hypothetical protein